MRETGRSGYKTKLRKKLTEEFPQCETHLLDPNDIQGVPDLLILCPLTWATLEVKADKKSSKRPNQDYYTKKHNDMSFSNFIYPENEEEVLRNLRKHLNLIKKENIE